MVLTCEYKQGIRIQIESDVIFKNIGDFSNDSYTLPVKYLKRKFHRASVDSVLI